MAGVLCYTSAIKLKITALGMDGFISRHLSFECKTWVSRNCFRTVGRMFAVVALLPFSISAVAADVQLIPEGALSAEALASLPRAPQVTHHTVFKGKPGAQYNHGAVMITHKGRYFMQWQSATQDEDAPDTQVLYAISEDGEHWYKPRVMAGSGNGTLITNGGWWSDGDTLVAYFNVWPNKQLQTSGNVLYSTSTDGLVWQPAKRLKMAEGTDVSGIIEQDLHTIPSGRILTTLHRYPGLIATPMYTDNPSGTGGWQLGELPHLPFEGKTSREIEPAWFSTNNQLTMVFRDQASSFRVLRSTSNDDGEHCSLPQITNMPDARAKLSAGNLPNGWTFIVNCPSDSKTRMPLVLSLSENGKTFNRFFMLRNAASNIPMRYEGKYKRVGFSYPKSWVTEDALYIAYAENKEDIVVTKVPLNALFKTK